MHIGGGVSKAVHKSTFLKIRKSAQCITKIHNLCALYKAKSVKPQTYSPLSYNIYMVLPPPPSPFIRFLKKENLEPRMRDAESNQKKCLYGVPRNSDHLVRNHWGTLFKTRYVYYKNYLQSDWYIAYKFSLHVKCPRCQSVLYHTFCTLQPLSSNAVQIFSPMPCAPPVTMATQPRIFIF